MDNFKLFGDRILLKQLQHEEKTKGGLIMAPAAQNKPTRGIVVALGPGTDKVENPGFKVGDTVFFGSYSGMEVEIDQEPLLLLRFGDVVGIFPEKEEKFIV